MYNGATSVLKILGPKVIAVQLFNLLISDSSIPASGPTKIKIFLYFCSLIIFLNDWSLGSRTVEAYKQIS